MSLLCVLSDFVQQWLLNIARKIQDHAFESEYNDSKIYLQNNQFSGTLSNGFRDITCLYHIIPFVCLFFVWSLIYIVTIYSTHDTST